MEGMHIQPLMAGDPIQALNAGVLRPLAWLDIQHRVPVLDGPDN